MKLNKGYFIVVEGLEGAGKSTAMRTIKHFFEDKAPEIITTREPGGTHVGETARQLIKHSPPAEPLDSRAELLLLYAARVQLLELVIRPAINRGACVIADRFEWSTWAYQGSGRKLNTDMIGHLSHFCVNDLTPDLIIYLDISPEQGLKRIQNRRQIDRIEQEALSFFEDVHAGYQKLIKTSKQVVVIDASKPLAVVQDSIIEALEAFTSMCCET